MEPLEDIRILSLALNVPGPVAIARLRDLGAAIVKIEPPGRGDSGRASQPAITDEDGRRVGATYLRNNLSKRSLALDLQQEAGRALFRRNRPTAERALEAVGLDSASAGAASSRSERRGPRVLRRAGGAVSHRLPRGLCRPCLDP